MERTARDAFHIQPREGVRMFASVDGRPDLVQLQSDLSALSIFTRWWQHGHGSLKLYAEVCAPMLAGSTRLCLAIMVPMLLCDACTDPCPPTRHQCACTDETLRCAV
jgi:hypothetical protein